MAPLASGTLSNGKILVHLKLPSRRMGSKRKILNLPLILRSRIISPWLLNFHTSGSQINSGLSLLSLLNILISLNLALSLILLSLLLNFLLLFNRFPNQHDVPVHSPVGFSEHIL